ncbi:MAG: copper chaperone PCu(A)C [Desulfobulbaceae bacterium]|nr:copper chaperone PCu(A)C [Desulfobulbaceae bacterium]
MKQLSFVILLVLFLMACAEDQAPLSVTDVIVTKPIPGMAMSAGYFEVTNNSRQAINITHITSPEFASVEMHETVIKNEVARMRALGALTLQPGETVSFEPGGKHLMLMRPSDNIESVTLQFFAGESVLLSVSTDFGR